MNAKPLRKSKTFWFNALTVVSVVLGAVIVGIGDLPITDGARAWIIFVVGIVQPAVNVMLRLKTHAPIEGSSGEAEARGLR